MDPVTHALASFALTRSLFPRVSRATLIGAIVAGTVADVDLVSTWMGPSAFFQWHRTYTHSLLGAAIIAAAFSSVLFVLARRGTSEKTPFLLCVLPMLCAVLLHLAMDICQADGIALFGPFRAQRYSADWVARLDLGIFAILLCGVLLPRLFGLVTSEIGAKAKGPKGRVGAAVALVVVLLYVGARAMFHGNAIAQVESRTYRGETPRRWAAIPESASPFLWHGIAETDRALHDVEVDVGPNPSFDPDAAITTYKPEPSAALDAARNTETARRFLQVARFPKASIEKTTTGFRIEIRGFPYRNDSMAGLRVIALIETDANAIVRNEELIWNPTSKERWISEKWDDHALAASR